MKIPNALKKTIDKDQIILVATSNKRGVPHLAATKGLILMGDERIAFRNWFCLETLRNITENPNIALSLFGPDWEYGYQLIGTVEKSVAAEVVSNAMSQDVQNRGDTPRAELQIQIKVRKILEFSTGPHSDEIDLSFEE
jgi:hypothetical protein